MTYTGYCRAVRYLFRSNDYTTVTANVLSEFLGTRQHEHYSGTRCETSKLYNVHHKQWNSLKMKSKRYNKPGNPRRRAEKWLCGHYAVYTSTGLHVLS